MRDAMSTDERMKQFKTHKHYVSKFFINTICFRNKSIIDKNKTKQYVKKIYKNKN
jgi:hypothetical protein